MARPPKDAADRMTVILRIPVTAEQKRQIDAAAKANPSGMAAWARSVLLDAATREDGHAQRKQRRRANAEDQA